MTSATNQKIATIDTDKSFNVLFSRCNGSTYNKDKKGLSFSFFDIMGEFASKTAFVILLITCYKYFKLNDSSDLMLNLIALSILLVVSLVTFYHAHKIKKTQVPFSEIPDDIKNFAIKNGHHKIDNQMKLSDVENIFKEYKNQ